MLTVGLGFCSARALVGTGGLDLEPPGHGKGEAPELWAQVSVPWVGPRAHGRHLAGERRPDVRRSSSQPVRIQSTPAIILLLFAAK
jgi:hypothetical protein